MRVHRWKREMHVQIGLGLGWGAGYLAVSIRVGRIHRAGSVAFADGSGETP